MLPIILVGQNSKTADHFLRKYISDHDFDHSQIFKIVPKKSQLGIDEVREIRRMIVVASAKNRLFIFYSFDLSTFEAQNALLKTLEEKTQDNQFIFLCQNEEQIVPTVRSRSKVLYLDRGKANIFADPDIDLFINKIIDSSNKLDFLNNDHIVSIKNTEALSMIDQIILYFRNRAKMGDDKSIGIIKKSLELRYLLANNNLNPQLTIDNLLIYIFRKYRIK